MHTYTHILPHNPGMPELELPDNENYTEVSSLSIDDHR